MKRHSQNQNLVIHEESGYSGLPVQVGKGPFVKQYLERLYSTIGLAVGQYSRVFAFRVDLRFPKDAELPESAYTNQVINRRLQKLSATRLLD